MATDLPHDWANWPRDARINYLTLTRSRAGLMVGVLSLSGVDVDDVPDDRKLRKAELAAVHLALEDGEA